MSEKQSTSPLWLTDSEVSQLLTTHDAYDAVVQALIHHAKGKFIQPLKPYIRPRGREEEYSGGRFIAMPGFLDDPIGTAGIKWISGFPANIERGIPRASGLMVLNSTETGNVDAIMPCETLSARRTAAVASISIDHCASETAKRIAIIGAGPIGLEVADSLLDRPRNIEELRICDLRDDRLRKAQELFQTNDHSITISAYNEVESAVKDANVIVTATTNSEKAYLKDNWLTDGWVFVALSLDDADPEVVTGSDKLVVDDFDQCNREEKLLHRLIKSGMLVRDQVYGTLGEIVSGGKAGREIESENIYVNPMGMAIEDIAVAARIYEKAGKQSKGILLPL
ncbi:hypothetical protein KJ652_04085 [Patescibacteria group bacterium]|nr:hypothetical protein [Patescibacteria group bacterium]MBU1123745.1 hypothetical protein [Patescibacteria group bacterium]MBU1910832.1 hypothetical protein [Patescibacteria group bacterium]